MLMKPNSNNYLLRFGSMWTRRATVHTFTPLSLRFQSSNVVAHGKDNHNNSSMIQAPKILTTEMATGCQDAMKLFLKYGLGMQRLKEISKSAGDLNTLVPRWQRMMEAFIGTQVHVLAGMGYSPDESGLASYNTHLAMLMQNIDPDTREKIRISGRDMWREVMTMAFNVSLKDEPVKEMSIVDARNLMYKVSQRMIEEDILGSIRQQCEALEPLSDQIQDMARKHQIIQSVLVHQVYLGTSNIHKKSLVVESGFEDGEKGYVRMQCIMAEHLNDPLVGQYMGSAMMQILQAANLDLGAIQKAAETAYKQK